MKITWLGGWAIPTARVRAAVTNSFPDAEHHIIYPGEHWQKHLPQSEDLYIGYSLGAFLLLKNRDVLPDNAKITVLAPFLDLKSESNLGGRVSITQLKVLKRAMKQNMAAALNDFYKRAGLRVRCDGELPYSNSDLCWGIDQLIEGQAKNNAFDGVTQVIVGAEDLLVHAARIAELCTHAKVVEGAGHRLAELLGSVEL